MLPDGRYRHLKGDVGTDGVLLIDRTFPRVHVHLDAEIPETGDLLLSGQDLGIAAAAMGGGGEYEYYISVNRSDLPELVAALMNDPIDDEETTIRRYQIETASTEAPGEVFHAGGASIRYSDLNRLTLLLLRDRFIDGTFTNSSDFMEWCFAHDIPYSGAAF